MGNGLSARALVQVARVFRDGTFVGMSDRQILERFVECQDELAFEAILVRHGPMVRNVCRQILLDPHDVDDAVQAVFLVLVRKARFIRVDGSLGPWLYAVAGRVAARARAGRRRRRDRERSAWPLFEPSYSAPGDSFEIPHMIHDELRRLPERLRAPLVLCYLEGLTHDIAARQLDCPVGTVRSRLARGRSLLHRRITRRGFTLSAAAVGGMLESDAGAAVCSRLPESLVESITQAMVETVRQNGRGLFTSLATIPGRSLVRVTNQEDRDSGHGDFRGDTGDRRRRPNDGWPDAGAETASGPVPRRRSPARYDARSSREEREDSAEERSARRGDRVEARREDLDQHRQVPLLEAVGFLQNYTGVNIVLDPKALSELGLTSVVAGELVRQSGLAQDRAQAHAQAARSDLTRMKTM